MSKPTSFTFGEEITPYQYLNLLTDRCIFNGQYYELPFSVHDHGRYFYRLLFVRSAIQTKTRIISSCFKPHRWLSRISFSALVMDYLWFGNCYLEIVRNHWGKTVGLRHSPAKYTRRGLDNRYYFLPDSLSWEVIHEFDRGSVLHLLEADVNQELYGVPEWLPTVESALLNEAATKFRLRYYNNGSHAGFIMYMTDANMDQGDIDALRVQLQSAKGVGNFKNLLLYSPNGKTDGIKLIPLAEVAAKDEFLNIKSISRDDQLAACRVPPQLMGIIPENSGGFGSASEAAQVFARNEIQPLQEHFRQINDWLGAEVISFTPYQLTEDEPAK